MQKGKKIIVGVLGLPVRKNGKGWEFFLTQRLSFKHSDAHLKWQLAGGGMEFGETPEETLVREFQEELSVTPKIIYPHPIVITNTWNNNTAGHSHNAHIVLLNYLVDIDNQKPINTDPDCETGDMGWFNWNEIQKLDLMPNSQAIFAQAKQIIARL